MWLLERACQTCSLCGTEHLYWCFWIGEGSQGPDNVESGERAGGEKGAGHDNEIPSNHLQIGFPHGYSECSCVN